MGDDRGTQIQLPLQKSDSFTMHLAPSKQPHTPRNTHTSQAEKQTSPHRTQPSLSVLSTMATAKGHSSPDSSGPLDVNVSTFLEFSNLDTEGLTGCLKSKQILDKKTERLIREDCWRGRGLLAAPTSKGAMLTHGQAISDIFHFISNLTTPGIIGMSQLHLGSSKF